MTDAVERSSLTPTNPARAEQARNAAIVLFAEHGYRGTTINHIADVLGIRGPSLYKHVSSKQDLLQDIIVSTMALLIDEQARAIDAESTPTQQLRAMSRAMVRVHVEDQPRAYVCQRELASLEEPARSRVQDMRDAFWRRTHDLVKAGMAAGEFTVTSAAVATFCLAELLASPATWFDASRGVSYDEISDQVATLALRMLGANPA